MIQPTPPFAKLMRRAKWRVRDVRNLAGVDYTTAAAWKKGLREMKIAHAVTLTAAADKAGIKTTVFDFAQPVDPAAEARLLKSIHGLKDAFSKQMGRAIRLSVSVDKAGNASKVEPKKRRAA